MNDVLELLRSEPVLWIGIAVLLGLMIGSFLNVVVHRLPKMMEREWAAQAAELKPEAKPESAVTADRVRQLPPCSVRHCGTHVLVSCTVAGGRPVGCKRAQRLEAAEAATVRPRARGSRPCTQECPAAFGGEGEARSSWSYRSPACVASDCNEGLC